MLVKQHASINSACLNLPIMKQNLNLTRQSLGSWRCMNLQHCCSCKTPFKYRQIVTFWSLRHVGSSTPTNSPALSIAWTAAAELLWPFTATTPSGVLEPFRCWVWEAKSYLWPSTLSFGHQERETWLKDWRGEELQLEGGNGTAARNGGLQPGEAGV